MMMTTVEKDKLIIAIKGAGEMASAIAFRLHQARMGRLFMMEVSKPLAVRRGVSFCEALWDGKKEVEGVTAYEAGSADQFNGIWDKGGIAVICDPEWQAIRSTRPNVLIDAILAKKNLGTHHTDAPLVIGIGPGFHAGKDVHLVVESNRGHHLGRIVRSGRAEENTGIPGNIAGFTTQRVLRAPEAGIFLTETHIGHLVKAGAAVGTIGDKAVVAQIDGVIRGLIRNGTPVKEGVKLGDIDPRGETSYCYTISDKARAIAGSVLEAILNEFPPFGE
jgi:xanthine dehydrogenase accessory factor